MLCVFLSKYNIAKERTTEHLNDSKFEIAKVATHCGLFRIKFCGRVSICVV
jgi:hypothetical protein